MGRKLLRWSKNKEEYVISLLIYTIGVIVGVVYQKFQKAIPLKYENIDFFLLLKHNLMHIALIIFLGVATFCLYSIAITAINGFALGITIMLIIQNKKLSAFVTGLAPHGIFEISALIIASAVPFMFYRILWQAIKQKDKRTTFFFRRAKSTLIKPIIVSFVCIFFAAFIESYISTF